MRRVWRFILALSVTPLMTAACLGILAWMTWNVALEYRFGSSQWHVGKVVYWLQESTRRYPPGWPPRVYRRGAPPQVFVVIEDGSGLRRVDGDSIDDPTATCVILTTDFEPIARSGMFAITSEWWRTSATLMQGGTQVVSPKLSARIAEKMKHDRGLSMYANTVLISNGRVPTVVWSGYMYNAIAVVVAALCAYSLQWIWRGARMPWSMNRAWGIAAGKRTLRWWCGRTLLWSPWATLLFASLLVVLVMVNRSPRWEWQVRLRDLLQAAPHVADLLQYDPSRLPESPFLDGLPLPPGFLNRAARTDPILPAPWLTQNERDEWGKAGIRIPVFHSNQYPFLAPMTTSNHAAVELLVNPSNSYSLREHRDSFQNLMISRGVITPEQAPLLWTVQPKRIVWQGVLFNGLMLIVAGAFLASLVWLRDGVVWPWNARRLRQGVCLKCSYSLIGLNAAKCPECGTQVPSPA